jgi:hypothetical protein
MTKTSLTYALLAVLSLAFLSGTALAGEEDGLLVNLGNEKCPIMKKPVTGRNWVDWNGLRIGICCNGCVRKVLADPEKVLDDAGIDWRETAELVKKAEAAEGDERAEILKKIAASHGIVRGGEEVAVAKQWVVDLGNAKCPIMGGKVDGKTYTIWNGVRIGHCCPGCTSRTLANPEAVLDKAGIEWREASRYAWTVANAKPEKRKELVDAAPERMTLVQVDAGPVVDLGNTRCPIMGGKVDGKTYTVWNGVRIGHCCPGCISRTLANPEKVLDEAGIDWREASKAVAAVRNASGKKRAELLESLKSDYDVVGE